MSRGIARRLDTFISTKEHRRFVEFANAVRMHRYIGLCFGPPGVGKTLSGRHYANCHRAGALPPDHAPRRPADAKIYAALTGSRTLFFTPAAGVTAGGFRRDMERQLYYATTQINKPTTGNQPRKTRGYNEIELVIIDEAERLCTAALEYMRDFFDSNDIGLLLIGMPGIEKRMMRYPQLYSRVGFAHHYRPLQGDALQFVLIRHWRKLGLNLDAADFSDTQAIASIARITGGNFRLLHRLFVQIERVLQINKLPVITDEVVNVARSTLVIGAN